MTQLLTEYTTFECEKVVLNEEKYPNGKSKFIMKGVLQRSDTLNQNGRIYPRVILEREIRNYQKLVKERRALGALDHPDSSIIELNTVSHLVTEARMENGVVYGVLEILPTPSGEIMKNLVESNVTVGISSRGVGSVKTDENGYQIVQDDFHLIAFDLVIEPSTTGAFLVKEGKVLTESELKKITSTFINQSDRIDRIINEILDWEK